MKPTAVGPEDGAEAGTRETVNPEAISAVPSADQHSYNDSLRAGVRGLGVLVREQKRGGDRVGE